MFVEISSADLRRDHALIRAAARRLEDYNVGISIGDVMAEARAEVEEARKAAGEQPKSEDQS